MGKSKNKEVSVTQLGLPEFGEPPLLQEEKIAVSKTGPLIKPQSLDWMKPFLKGSTSAAHAASKYDD